MSRPLMFFMALLFVFAGLMTIFYARRMVNPTEVVEDASHQQQEAPTKVENALEDFVLTDQTGGDFDSTTLKGKVWVGSIFFATCPSTCRMQNMRVAELQQRFGEQGVEFVSITCDPENDTPAALSDYSKKFGAQQDKWHFLTGDLGLIKRIGGEKFGITVDDKVHSDRLILFDREGKLVGTYRSLEPEQFAQLVKELKRLVEAPAAGAAADDPPEADHEKAAKTEEEV